MTITIIKSVDISATIFLKPNFTMAPLFVLVAGQPGGPQEYKTIYCIATSVAGLILQVTKQVRRVQKAPKDTKNYYFSRRMTRN